MKSVIFHKVTTGGEFGEIGEVGDPVIVMRSISSRLQVNKDE